MKFHTVFVIFRKELLDMLRDKRTLIAMLGIPIVLYPALFIFGSQAAMMERDRVAQAPSRVAIVADQADILEDWLHGEQSVALRYPGDPEAELAAGRIQAVVVLEGDLQQDLEEGRAAQITILYDATDTASQEAVKRLLEAFNAREADLLKTRLEDAGIPADFVNPLEVSRENVAPSTRTTQVVLGMLMPPLMIVMLGIGAFYPAIDLTAGEKERGTFETLLSTPTSSYEILSGKFLTVFILALLTGLTNLGSMVATFAFQLAQLQGDMGVFELRLPISSVVVVILALLPLAFFISAVMMSIAVLARSFREAQSLLTPFLLILLFPSGYAAVPSVHLTTSMQFVPIANFALLFKDLMTSQVDPQSIVMVLLSTTVYACIALYVAARIFRREDVVLSEDRGLPLTLRRSFFRPRAEPTPGIALFIFTLCLLLLFYVGTYAQSELAVWGIVVTQWGLFLLPTLLVLWYVRVDLRNALSLRLPPAGVWLATLVIAVGWATLSLQFSVWQQKILPFPEDLAKQMEELIGLGNQPFWFLILVLALSPAICEEVVFRGAVLSGLRRHLPWWALFLCVGIAFGVAHISIHRMILTALSGILLTYLVWRSRSIFPGMLTHFLINTTGIVLQSEHVPESIQPFVDRTLKEEQGFPWWLIALAAIVCTAGILLMERFRPHREAT
ncbi:MAG: ABC transporter permease [Candidatus Hydrogenedentes bacterium]|nr:ABC transporter permease [Candidatus Hydrogenedentota bacterium]